VNTLHGSLVEANEKLKGLLDRLRKPELFRGDLGEALLITRRLRGVWLRRGSASETRRISLESGCSSLGRSSIQSPAVLALRSRIFAPTILDGGVTKFTTGDIAEQVMPDF
jgi:hypothetical protein